MIENKILYSLVDKKAVPSKEYSNPEQIIESKVVAGQKKNNRPNVVIDIAEIGYLKMLVTASSSKLVKVWNLSQLNKGHTIFIINMFKGGVHQIKFFKDYRVLLVAGYENNIPILQISAKHTEIDIKGKLAGHLSLITAIECVESTPMVISADDSGCIKIWDIRSLKCFQTIDLNQRTSISKLVDVFSLNRIAFIGCRVSYLEFDKISQNRKMNEKNNIPIKADIDIEREQLIVSTTNGVRYYDLATGRVKKVVANLINKETEDEITAFSFLENNRRFVLGDIQGNIYVIKNSTSDKILRLENHEQEVIGISYDQTNDLYVSLGAESVIKIHQHPSKAPNQNFDRTDDKSDISFSDMNYRQVMNFIEQENKLERENYAKKLAKRRLNLTQNQQKESVEDIPKAKVLREIRNPHSSRVVKLLAVSIYHNLIATAADNNIINIYNYEFGKLTFKIELFKTCYITRLQFFDEYPILLVSNSDSKLFLIKFDFGGSVFFQAELIAMCSYKKSKKFGIYKESCFLKKKDVSKNCIDNSILDIEFQPEKPSQTDEESSEFLFNNNPIQKDLKCSYIIASKSKGSLVIYEITKILEKLKIVRHCKERANYNPYRVTLEDYKNSIQKKTKIFIINRSLEKKAFDINETKLNEFKVHSSNITSIKVIHTPQKLILTCSRDQYIKILKFDGMVICELKIVHPLPLRWEIKYHQIEKQQKKVYLALKILESIYKRYFNLLYKEGSCYKLKGFSENLELVTELKSKLDQNSKVDIYAPSTQLTQKVSKSSPQNKFDTFIEAHKSFKTRDSDIFYEEKRIQKDDTFQMTQINTQKQNLSLKKKKILVMKDEYQSRDFLSKEQRMKMMEGVDFMNLKQIEEKRRIILSKQDWNRAHNIPYDKYREYTPQLPPYFDNLVGADNEEPDKYWNLPGMQFGKHLLRKMENFHSLIESEPVEQDFEKPMKKVHYESLKEEKSPRNPFVRIVNKKTFYDTKSKNRRNYLSRNKSLDPTKLKPPKSPLKTSTKIKNSVRFIKLSKKPNLSKKEQFAQLLKADEPPEKFNKSYKLFDQVSTMKRRQKITRRTNQERKKFTGLLQGLNNSLKSSQIYMLNNRSASALGFEKLLKKNIDDVMKDLKKVGRKRKNLNKINNLKSFNKDKR